MQLFPQKKPFFFAIPKTWRIFAKKISNMRKEIGKWFFDVAKYVTTVFLISTFLGDFEKKWIMYLIGFACVVITFVLGLYFMNDKK